MRTWPAKLLIASLTLLAVGECLEAVEPITADTPWRVFLVCKSQDRHRKEPEIVEALVGEIPAERELVFDFNDAEENRR